ncbi:DUF4838 domain-containing protein, partial [bacterium]|nr:DUF4838 domain-containing protein [bacterium]
ARSALLALLALGTSAPTRAADLVVVQDGAARAAIYLPAQTEFDQYADAERPRREAFLRQHNPGLDAAALQKLVGADQKKLAAELKRVGDEEKLAAAELQEFLGKVSGATLETRTREPDADLPAGPAILLGSALARRAGLGKDLDALEPDGFIGRVKDGRLILAGRRGRGTLYAAYDWLESLGVRWIMPGEFGELLPELKTVTTAYTATANPSHRQRYWWCTYGTGDGYARWTLRNKGNFIRALGDPVIAQGHALAGPLRRAAARPEYGETVKVTKTVGRKLPDGTITNVTEEVEERRLPDEYYAWARNQPRRSVPNMSNPKVWDLYASDYIQQLDRSPDQPYLSLSAEDGLTLDDRPESHEFDANEFDWTIGAMSATDRMWFFHRRVISQVTKVHPEAKFGVLVYSNNMMPPRIERVDPHMALILAPLSICPLHHVRDDQCKTNRAYREWLESWMAQAKAAGAETYYYDYDPIGFSWNLAMISPQWGIIGKNYPWFHSLGLTGHTTQGHDDWAATGLNHWLMIRLYWNAEQDYHDIIADYCQRRFGAAAPAMQEYFDILERRMDAVTDGTANEVWGNHLVLTPEVRAQCRTAIQKAVKTADSPRAKAHVDTMVAIQQSTDIFCDAIEHARKTGDFGAAANQIEAVFGIADQLNAKYAYFMNPKRVSKESKAEFLTGGWYHKYRRFDAVIKGSAASLVLPRQMKLALDTANLGWARGWHRPDSKATDMPEGDSTLIPDVVFGTEREPAAFFYRTDATVPRSFAGHKQVNLYFPSLIARAVQVWVNGEPVEFDHETYRDTTWRGPDYFWMNYDHQQRFDVTSLIKPGARNTIAFRVFKSFDHGGSYDRIFLLADPPAPPARR